jgi:hypothetical protein
MSINRLVSLKALGILIAVGLFCWSVYWTWCWGWWGQENKWLQYLLQCQCPTASEEARYTDNMDVLFSACENPLFLDDSPSGRYIRVSLHGSIFIYDQQSDALSQSIQQGRVYFLTDDLIVFTKKSNNSEPIEYILFDLNKDQQLTLELIPMDRNHAYNPAALTVFHKADKVYVTGSHSAGLAVALAQDYLQHPESNFVFGRAIAVSPTPVEEITDILQSNGIDFELSMARNNVSHNGSYEFSGDDIVLVPSKQLISRVFNPDDRFYGQAWAYEDKGVIYESPQGVYLIGRPDRPLSLLLFRVPQPLLLLKVPIEYLGPEARQADEAKQAQEKANKQQAMTTFGVINLIVMALVVAVSILSFWRQRKPSKNQMVADS